jgi:hypothetical protein
MRDSLPSPWKEFLHQLDDSLSQPVQLHCIGGFAAVIAYQLPRSTNDLDYFTLTPTKSVNEIQELAGEGSPLATKYRVHAHHAAVASLPDGYEQRCESCFLAASRTSVSSFSIHTTWFYRNSAGTPRKTGKMSLI